MTPDHRPPTSRPRIYFAGPDVFFPDADRIFDALRQHCDRLGLVGIEPSDGGLAESAQPGDDEHAQRIYQGNIDRIREADGLIANLMNFRGHEPDSGTVFEVGFAVALGKPVVAYGVPPGTYADRVSAAIPCAEDDRGQLRESASGAMVEGLGQRLNLMLTRSVAIEETAEAALRRLAEMVAASP
ncbi:MAG: nucleoside 2-deoxyribosyltransferase, partial [Gammaproteobacteria bacterium]|nr:nucleoside 2-deoxyribosyltransferase [Gammaproteobacteria bacterium]